MCAVLGCLLFALMVALLPVWPMALMLFFSVIAMGYLGYVFFNLPERIFLEVWEGQIKVNRILSSKHDLVVIKDIKHLQHLGHRMRFIMADASTFSLHLNYLSNEDIKRLFIFFKFVPSGAKKML